MADTVDIGLVLGAFGIKGESRVASLYDDPTRFETLQAVCLVFPDGSERTFQVEKVRLHKGVALVRLEGVRTRTQADALKNCVVRVPREQLTAVEVTRLEKHRLISLEVTTVEGERLGVIEEVIETGANDVYHVRDGNRTVLLPAIKDVIRSIDLESGRVVVSLIPGLL